MDTQAWRAARRRAAARVQARGAPDSRIGQDDIEPAVSPPIALFRRPAPLIAALVLSALFIGSAFMGLGVTGRTLLFLPILISLAFIIVIDVRLHIIPDAITIPATGYALLVALTSGLAGLGWAAAAAAISAMAILILAIVSRGGIGGGDIKLMALIGAALGWRSALGIFVISQFLALAVAAAIALTQRKIFKRRLPIGAIIAALAAVGILTNRS